MLYSLLRTALYAISGSDAEKAHIAAIQLLKFLQRHPALLGLVETWQSRGIAEDKPGVMCGIRFPNRFGMAAGFDKHAEVIPALAALGFGFVEVGAILPYAQAGNPRPRVFRLDGGHAAINRMGFNSVGVEAARANWAALAKVKIPVIVNIGKMATTDVADIARVADDYETVVRTLHTLGELLCANVSSPNTKDLRSLQTTGLRQLVERMRKADNECRKAIHMPPRPLLVKVAPDLKEYELDVVIDEAMAGGAAGFIFGNTHMAWPDWVKQRYGDNRELFTVDGRQKGGGYSGNGTFSRTLEMVRQGRRRAPKAGIVACGGVCLGTHARQAVDESADLVQAYTGLIAHGPELIRESRKELAWP